MKQSNSPHNNSGSDPDPFRLWAYRAVARRLPGLERALHSAFHHLRHLRPSRFSRTVSWLLETLASIRQRRQESRLTVGVDVSALWESLTGIGWYLYQILDHLKENPDVRIRMYGPSIIMSPDLPAPKITSLPQGEALETVLYDIPTDLAISQGSLITILRRLQRIIIRLDGNTVLFAPNYFLPDHFQFCRGVRVSTVHDLGFRKVPWTLRENTLRELAERFEPAVFGADRLISVSAAVRDELQAFGYASPDRVEVIYHGPGQLSEMARSEQSSSETDFFVLHVGTIEPRKNVDVILEAWPYLRQHLDPCPTLILGGRFGWKSDEIQVKIERGTEEGWIRHLGYINTEHLAELYKSAAAVVFPSFYEGFGLPAIEAMWAGTPLVCSDIPTLREVAGEAALYFEPDRPDLLADRLQTVLTDADLHAELASKGRSRLADFNWDIAARKTLEVWYRAAGRLPPG
jgi:alpha-1,3-rhamnosyl/mannosyltransferase